MSVAELETRQNANPFHVYLERISQKPFLAIEEEQKLGPAIKMYRQVIKAVISMVPAIRSEGVPRQEKAEGYILRIIQDVSNQAYPASDFCDVVSRGREAVERLMEANYRLVVDVAMCYKTYCTPGLNLWDLISAGNLALRRAALNFDHTLGYRFTTYADECVGKGVQREIKDHSRVIRISSERAHDLVQYSQTREKFRVENHREPSSTELAAMMGTTLLRLKNIERSKSSTQVISLDVAAMRENRLSRNYRRTRLDIIGNLLPSPEDQYTQDELREQLLGAMNIAGLTERQKEILRLRYGFIDEKPWPRKEVGKHLGISDEWVRLLEKDALDKLKESSEERLVAYLYNY